MVTHVNLCISCLQIDSNYRCSDDDIVCFSLFFSFQVFRVVQALNVSDKTSIISKVERSFNGIDENVNVVLDKSFLNGNDFFNLWNEVGTLKRRLEKSIEVLKEITESSIRMSPLSRKNEMSPYKPCLMPTAKFMLCSPPKSSINKNNQSPSMPSSPFAKSGKPLTHKQSPCKNSAISKIDSLNCTRTSFNVHYCSPPSVNNIIGHETSMQNPDQHISDNLNRNSKIQPPTFNFIPDSDGPMTFTVYDSGDTALPSQNVSVRRSFPTENNSKNVDQVLENNSNFTSNDTNKRSILLSLPFQCKRPKSPLLTSIPVLQQSNRQNFVQHPANISQHHIYKNDEDAYDQIEGLDHYFGNGEFFDDGNFHVPVLSLSAENFVDTIPKQSSPHKFGMPFENQGSTFSSENAIVISDDSIKSNASDFGIRQQHQSWNSYPINRKSDIISFSSPKTRIIRPHSNQLINPPSQHDNKIHSRDFSYSHYPQKLVTPNRPSQPAHLSRSFQPVNRSAVVVNSTHTQNPHLLNSKQQPTVYNNSTGFHTFNLHSTTISMGSPLQTSRKGVGDGLIDPNRGFDLSVCQSGCNLSKSSRVKYHNQYALVSPHHNHHQ